MSKPMLITYATRFGSTADVAHRIGSVFRREGVDVAIQPIADVTSLEAYAAVLIGSPVRSGRWLPEAVHFLKRFEANLINTPAAYFTVCVTLRNDTPENRRIVSGYHDPLLYDFPDIEPVSIGMFAGALDRGKMSGFLQLYTRVVQLPHGDWRSWAKVDAWAREVLPLLQPV